MKIKPKTTHLSLALLCTAILFAGCKNLFETSERSSSEQDSFITIRGTLIAEGAVPAGVAGTLQEAQGRTAVPSVPADVFYTVSATQGSTTYNATVDGKSFEIKLTKGSWKLNAEGYSDSEHTEQLFSGTAEVTVQTAPLSSVEIGVKPTISQGSGTVNLEINAESGSGIKSVKAVWSEDGTQQQILNIDDSTGKAAFTMKKNTSTESIASGSYSVQFFFYAENDAGGEILFSCCESVNVFQNMQTNTWIKNGTSSYITEDNGTTVFKLTKALVSDYIKKTLYVQGTDASYTPTVAAKDSNSGTYFDPLATLQKAVDKITAINDGTSSYTIFVDGILKPATVPDENPAIAYYKQNTNLSLTIQGLGTDRSKNIIDAAEVSKRQILSFNYDTASATNINVTVKNLCLTNANCTEKLTSDETYGGAVNGSANYVFDNVHAYNNKAKYGGVIYSAGNVTLQNGTVFGNKDATSSATNSDYSNYAVYNGGAIRMADGTLTIKKGCYVSYNYCQGESSTNAGGGISIQGEGKLVLEEGAYIQYNYCKTYGGGGVYLQTANSSAQIYGTITGNTTGGNGGGIYVNKGTVTINGTVSNNTATSGWGGGVYVNANGTLTLESTGVIGNSQATSAATYDNCSNYALNGGGVFVCSNGTATISGTISYNYAINNGGGVYVDANGTATISGAVSKNTAKENGGGVYVNANDTLKINGAACITSDNDVYLPDNKTITIAGNLTESFVATITPKNYTEGTEVLMQADGVSSVTDELCSKFSVTSQTSGSNKTYWAVLPSTDNTKGVLKKQTVSAKILTPVENNYKTILLNKTKETENYNYFIYGDTVSFKMTDSGGNTITPDSSSAYIAILQNGNTITYVTAGGTEYPELTVPSYLPAERYELYTKAAINGETFCSTKQIYIIKNEVSSYMELKCIAYAINSGLQANIRLKNDITLEDDWKYMCAESTLPFNGVFDGGGHTITVPKCTVNADAEYAVLFGHIGASGTVKNLVIESTGDVVIDAGASETTKDISVFAICNYGTIRNCTNRINLKGKTTTGVAGICTRNRGLIENCLNAGNITNTSAPYPNWAGVYCIVGGITAYNGAPIPGTIKNCYNSGTIKAKSEYENTLNINGVPGAICGNIANNSSVKYSYWNENCVKKSTITLNCVAYKSSNHDGILGSAAGCGSVASGGTTITAGTAENCKTDQTLKYGTSLQEALNGWIDAQTVPGDYKRWKVTDNGPELIYE